VVSSQTVGEEVQTLLSIAVELVEDQETAVRKTHREAGGRREREHSVKNVCPVYLSLHLCDGVKRRLHFAQQDAAQGIVGMATGDQKVKREWRAGSEPRPRQISIVFRIHPKCMQLTNKQNANTGY
jgi:hypothetical protein